MGVSDLSFPGIRIVEPERPPRNFSGFSFLDGCTRGSRQDAPAGALLIEPASVGGFSGPDRTGTRSGKPCGAADALLRSCSGEALSMSEQFSEKGKVSRKRKRLGHHEASEGVFVRLSPRQGKQEVTV